MHGQNEAVALEANAIETKHVLLGLLGVGDELVTEALRAEGLPERRPPKTPPLPRIHTPFTPEAKKLFERAQGHQGVDLPDRPVVSLGHMRGTRSPGVGRPAPSRACHLRCGSTAPRLGAGLRSSCEERAT